MRIRKCKSCGKWISGKSLYCKECRKERMKLYHREYYYIRKERKIYFKKIKEEVKHLEERRIDLPGDFRLDNNKRNKGNRSSATIKINLYGRVR